MWTGDRAWASCPRCGTPGPAILIAVAPGAAPPYVIYRCLRCRRIWKHAPPPEEWRYIESPPAPLPPPVYQLARGPAESGPWAHFVAVLDEESGHRALGAYRAAHPDEWVALLVGGGPVIRAAPWNEWATKRAAERTAASGTGAPHVDPQLRKQRRNYALPREKPSLLAACSGPVSGVFRGPKKGVRSADTRPTRTYSRKP